MTRLNAQLRRQALILSLLPDMVLAINADGVITFCSAQAERILQHNSEDLVGAKLSQLLVPSSRDALSGLVDELVATQSKMVLVQDGGARRRPAAKMGLLSSRSTRNIPSPSPS